MRIGHNKRMSGLRLRPQRKLSLAFEVVFYNSPTPQHLRQKLLTVSGGTKSMGDGLAASLFTPADRHPPLFLHGR